MGSTLEMKKAELSLLHRGRWCFPARGQSGKKQQRGPERVLPSLQLWGSHGGIRQSKKETLSHVWLSMKNVLHQTRQWLTMTSTARERAKVTKERQRKGIQGWKGVPHIRPAEIQCVFVSTRRMRNARRKSANSSMFVAYALENTPYTCVTPRRGNLILRGPRTDKEKWERRESCECSMSLQGWRERIRLHTTFEGRQRSFTCRLRSMKWIFNVPEKWILPIQKYNGGIFKLSIQVPMMQWSWRPHAPPLAVQCGLMTGGLTPWGAFSAQGVLHGMSSQEELRQSWATSSAIFPTRHFGDNFVIQEGLQQWNSRRTWEELRRCGSLGTGPLQCGNFLNTRICWKNFQSWSR